jgi:hypothetical protein
MRSIKQIVIALLAGVAFQGLIFLATELHLSFAEYLMFPGAYALSPIFPQGVHSENGTALFGIYLIIANTLCYALFSYLLILLIRRRTVVDHGL